MTNKYNHIYDFKKLKRWNDTEPNRYPATKTKHHKVGGPDENLNWGTVCTIGCPGDDCSKKGEIVMWHGWNNYVKCYSCGQIICIPG